MTIADRVDVMKSSHGGFAEEFEVAFCGLVDILAFYSISPYYSLNISCFTHIVFRITYGTHVLFIICLHNYLLLNIVRSSIL